MHRSFARVRINDLNWIGCRWHGQGMAGKESWDGREGGSGRVCGSSRSDIVVTALLGLPRGDVMVTHARKLVKSWEYTRNQPPLGRQQGSNNYTSKKVMPKHASM